MLTADEILSDLEQLVYREIVDQHGDKVALACATALVKCLFLNSNGKHIVYVPTAEQERQQRRQLYLQIWSEFTGDNHADLARRFRMSLQHIYNIIRHMRKAMVKRMQADLFADDISENSETPVLLRILAVYLPVEFNLAGLPMDDAGQLSQKISDYLCTQYAGLQFCITQAAAAKRLGGAKQESVF